MKSVSKTRPRLTGIMIALLMCVVYTLPPGLHLEICFGFDGHIDTTPAAWIIIPTGQPQQHVGDMNEHNHHENCIDVVVCSTSLDTLVRNVEKGGLYKTNSTRNNPSTAAGGVINEFFSQPGQPSDRSAFLHDVSVPSPFLLSRQTVLIQI